MSEEYIVPALARRGKIIDGLAKLSARFKCPKTVVFAELPKTSTGKIQKFKLREDAKAL